MAELEEAWVQGIQGLFIGNAGETKLTATEANSGSIRLRTFGAPLRMTILIIRNPAEIPA
jgi:hypothetical protein